MSSSQRRTLVEALGLVTLAAWGAAAWTSRQPRSWAGAGTDVLVLVAILATWLLAWGIAWLRTRPPRLAALRATALSLGLLLFVLLAELPALLGKVDYARVYRVASGEWSGPSTAFVDDTTLAWARPAHAHWAGRPRSDMAVAFNLPVRAASTQTFTTDARGFRNRLERDRAEVALVGDSYVEGAYVSDDETVAEQLERLGGRSVANLGRSGYGTLQELEVLRLYALPLRPQAVFWFFFEGNDLYDDEIYEGAVAYLRAHGSYAAPGWHAPDWGKFREASLSVNGFRLLRRALDPLVPVVAPSFGTFRDAHGDPRRLYFYRDAALRFSDFEEARLSKTEAAFEQGEALCRERGIRLLLVFVPSKFRVYGPLCAFTDGSPCASWRPWELEARFAAFCARERLPFLDLTEPMRAAAARGAILYAPEDSHWSAEGHRFVAGLLDGVRRQAEAEPRETVAASAERAPASPGPTGLVAHHPNHGKRHPASG